MSRSSSPDSLFSQGSMEDVTPPRLSDNPPLIPNHLSASGASRHCPAIPGLYVFPSLLTVPEAQKYLDEIIAADHFVGGTRDQVMFFSRVPTPTPPEGRKPGLSGLPLHLVDLSTHLADRLAPLLPEDVWGLVFKQNLARQCILNLYPPGQGISPHIDLAHRYADGIVGVSLLGATTMDFHHPTRGKKSVWLPNRSVYVLSGEARWEWTHGIEGRMEDWVEGEKVGRGVRVSVTFRWMKDGADVLS